MCCLSLGAIYVSTFVHSRKVQPTDFDFNFCGKNSILFLIMSNNKLVIHRLKASTLTMTFYFPCKCVQYVPVYTYIGNM